LHNLSTPVRFTPARRQERGADMSSPVYYGMSSAWAGSYRPYGYVPYQFTPAEPVLDGTPLLTLPPSVPLEPLLKSTEVTCMFGNSSGSGGGGLDVYAK
jgi:hypothetical protein